MLVATNKHGVQKTCSAKKLQNLTVLDPEIGILLFTLDQYGSRTIW